jgi:hypothetical protein
LGIKHTIGPEQGRKIVSNKPSLLLLSFHPHSIRSQQLFLSSDVSDRYNNLKASWDSLMEAASHGNPRSLFVAVTAALEQVKREELKRKNAESKK